MCFSCDLTFFQNLGAEITNELIILKTPNHQMAEIIETVV